jgi:hypothetical protein
MNDQLIPQRERRTYKSGDNQERNHHAQNMKPARQCFFAADNLSTGSEK